MLFVRNILVLLAIAAFAAGCSLRKKDKSPASPTEAPALTEIAPPETSNGLEAPPLTATAKTDRLVAEQ